MLNTMGSLSSRIPPRTALLVVDLQRDFLDDGALGVAGAKHIVPSVNHYLALFANAAAPIFLSRDWHPADHCSFTEQGGRWPTHCVAGSVGAEFPPDLQIPDTAAIVSKGTETAHEAYSAFEGTALAQLLHRRRIDTLWVAGLTTEICVQATVLDALRAGLHVVVLVDAIRAIDAATGDGDRALDDMLAAGAHIHAWPARDHARRTVAAKRQGDVHTADYRLKC